MSDLSRNEYHRRPSPEVLTALKESEVRFYSRTHGLRNKIAEIIGTTPERVRVGNGAEELLVELFQSMLRLPAGERVILMPDRTWPLYDVYLKDACVKKVEFPNGDATTYDARVIVEALHAHTPQMTILCSPNNPTSSVIAPEELETVLQNTKGIVVLDQTYHGFDNTDQNYTPVFDTYPNLVILRSFSKKYGLAGARIGWTLIHEETAQRVGLPRRMLGLSTIIENLGIAALDSQDHYDEQAREIVAERDSLIHTINATNKFYAPPSKTNFVFLRGPVHQLATKLAEYDIKIHVFPEGTYDGWARFGIGTKKDTAAILSIFTKWENPVSGTSS
jgi:histidinol-phosphate aminotransferase